MFGEENRRLVDVYVQRGEEHDLMIFKYEDGGEVPHVMTRSAPQRLDGGSVMLPE